MHKCHATNYYGLVKYIYIYIYEESQDCGSSSIALWGHQGVMGWCTLNIRVNLGYAFYCSRALGQLEGFGQYFITHSFVEDDFYVYFMVLLKWVKWSDF